MGSNRSVMSCFELTLLLLVFVIGFSDGVTNPSDVTALNKLYVALGSPPLLGWVDSGGDPCSGWQGVSCDAASSVEEINLMGANLGGELGDSLGEFSSIKHLLFTDNHIAGSIPSELPPSLIQFFLADNNLTGPIPSSLSSLTALSDLSLNNNQLNGEIPDAFGGMAQLSNLDLSGNSLSGELPPSLGNLSVLKILHMQDNQLSGTLDVLQDLRLTDLDVRNNQFNGPIPAKMLNIPNFQTGGNAWNSTPPLLTPPPIPSETPPTVLPATPPFFPGPTSRPPPPNSVQPPPTSGLRTPPSIVHTPPSSLRTPPSSLRTPPRQAEGPSATIESDSRPSNNKSKRRIVWISIAAVMSFIIIILAILLCMPRCLRKKRDTYRIPKRHEIAPYTGSVRENPSTSFLLHRQNEEKAPPPVPVVRPKEENRQRIASSIPKRNEEDGNNNIPISVVPRRNYHEIDLSFDMDVMPPPPPPPPASPPPAPPPPPSGKVIVNPITAAEAKPLPATSVKSYTIAALQQYTHSFSQENLIGGGMLGNVYRAELPNGRFLAVKKLDKRVTNKQSDEQFIELVNNLDKIRQANVVQLMGFCSEHGQRLLVYEYCSNGTLQDALHSDDEFKKQLTWNTRIRMALGAAKALEYLHEFCEPPVIHRNFKAINVLLDDELYVNVSDCGLAPLISSGGVSQLSGQLLTTYGYGAPEFESGVYTSKSDVYSFGVVMLELLTGRMSYDRTRSRGEQILVRWAIPQLHDIDALSRMVDPSLNGNYHVKSLSRFADIISRCVLIEPEFRPLMSEVVQDLMQMLRRDSPSISSDGD